MTESTKKPDRWAERAVRETDVQTKGPDGQARDDGRLYWRETASPLGTLTLVASERGLCGLNFGAFADIAGRLAEWAGRWWREPALVPAPEGHPLIAEAERQLDAYFRGELTTFTIPLDLRGTPFQLNVWEALCRVPYGVTATYGEIAAAIGRPGASRAVGGANNRNPVSIIVPCHRIIGTDGSLVGYGSGLWIKEHLLALEGALPIPSARLSGGKPAAAAGA